MTSFAVEPIYGSLTLAFVAVVVTTVVLVMVTPPTQNPIHRNWLITLRSIAAAVLLLTLVRPAFVRTDNRPAEAALIVAVDTSESMTLPDGSGGSRWDAQRESWRTLARGIEGIDESLDLRLLAYDESTRSLKTEAAALDAITPVGKVTDLAAATQAMIQAADGQPIAGVVLMGDGADTAPRKDADARRVAEMLDSLGVPFWTVPIGPAAGQTALRDVAVDSLEESYRMFSGNQVEIQFQILARGLAGIDIPIELAWIDRAGNATEFATRIVAPQGSNDANSMTVLATAPAPGTYRLQVKAVIQDGELVTNNNLQTAFVDVREGGGRILYLEGVARQEQRFLRHALRRFPDLDLTYRWISKDTSRGWPIDLGNAFESGRFDIYMIGDLDARALGDRQLEQLAESVGEGAGLVTLGGFQSYGAGGYAASPLSKVIPVKMDDSRRRLVSADTSDRVDQLKRQLTIHLARRHPITDLGGIDPAQTWLALPAQLGANRFLGPKIAPGVEVLLESSDQEPLLVVGGYGRGRTASVAFDSTWRWWRAGKDEAHRRFWRQLILWLMSREDAGDEIKIVMDSRRFAANEPPEFRASVQIMKEQSGPLDLVAELVEESGKVTPIEVTSDGRGTGIRGKLPVVGPGFHRLRVRPAREMASLPAEEMAFQSVAELRELAQPMADPVYLRQLASLTSDHGGAAFSPDEIESLVETIRTRRSKSETPIIEKFRLGDGPLSGWILFTVFAGALSTEWFLRRRWGLA